MFVCDRRRGLRPESSRTAARRAGAAGRGTRVGAGAPIVVQGRLVAGAGADAPGWATRRTPAGDLALDLSRVTAIDAAGIGVLLALRRRVVTGRGHLAVVAASARVTRALQITGLARLLLEADVPPAPRPASRDESARLCECAC